MRINPNPGLLTLSLTVLSAVFFSTTLKAAPLSWRMKIDRITVGSVKLENFSAKNRASEAVPSEIRVDIPSVRMTDPDYATGPLVVTCPGSTISVIDSWCQDGQWALRLSADWPSIEGTLRATRVEDDRIEVETAGTFGHMKWESTIKSDGDGSSLLLEIPQQSTNALDFLGDMIAAYSWISAGDIKAAALIKQRADGESQTTASVDFSGIEFDSPEGLFAGVGIAATIAVELDTQDEQPVVIDGELSAGELLLHDFYRDFSDQGIKLAAQADWSETHAEILRFVLTDDDAMSIVGQARYPLGTGNAKPEVFVREFRLDFPLAYERYLESVATVLNLDGLATSGSIRWAGDWSPGSARNGTLQLVRFSVNDEERGRFGIRGLDGQLSTGTTSRLNWDAFSFEKLNLGAGHTTLALTPENISLTEPLAIDVMGGTLSLEGVSFSLPRDGEPDIQLTAAVNNIEMLQMSRAMGWPEFGGTLSGRIPGVNWKGGIIEIDGALQFEVFDGEILLTDLRVERPFGVLPSMAANITASNLDLEELTQTFEFGRIGGRADGYIRNLRMLDWQPVQFDAWFGTPANDDERHGISRKAVQHMTAIGGGSATAILSGPILRLFNNFSYRRLGLGCELQNNICQIRGIEEQGEAVLLLEGAGIPKISIQAFNRAVDWPQLLAELTAVSGGEDIKIGD